MTQATFVLEGSIDLRMKGPSGEDFYTVELAQHEAGVSEAGDFFQLVNRYEEECTVLYIVSPAYLFEYKDRVIYDDSIILDQGWEQLKSINWMPKGLSDPKHSEKARKESYERLRNEKP